MDAGLDAFERWFPLPLEWEAVPRSVVVSQNQEFKPLADGLKTTAEQVVELYDGVEVHTDEGLFACEIKFVDSLHNYFNLF